MHGGRVVNGREDDLRISTPRARIWVSSAAAIVLAGWSFVTPLTPAVIAQPESRPPGWDEASHGPRAKPDYDRLFSLDRVHELRITIPPDRFRAMQEDLSTVVPGGFGRGGPFPGAGRGGGPEAGRGGAVPDIAAMMEAAAAACRDKKAADACTTNGTAGQCSDAPFGGGGLACMPAGAGRLGGRGGAPNLTTRDPMYVPVTVRSEGRTWTQVGMRYKGNSSLMASRAGANGKVPFRLDLDRYEDEHPAIRNQRFYGFQKLTFSSNVADDSQLREALAVEIFRDRGVPAARAAFYRVYVDAGSGSEYWGLYTLIEDPADGAMLDAQFGSSAGNLYKPEGPGADWSAFSREGFGKKTNTNPADFSDVEAAVNALHAPRNDPRAWRAALEARFDVEHFLRWLAVNTVIENWDAYGGLAHNYYLYGDPGRQGRLRWIPWDHNFAFGASPGGGGRGFGPPGAGGFPGGGGAPAPFPPGAPGGAAGAPFPPPGGRRGPPMFGGRGGSDVLHRQVGQEWPLIRRLLDDEVYATRYREELERALRGLLAPEAFERRARALHALIAPAAIAERPTHTTIGSPDAFRSALDGPEGLIARLRARQDVIRTALAEAGRR
jgi:hypothetical protein